MSRALSKGSPERLTPAEAEKFIKQHIPYRLRLLQLGRTVSPASGLLDSAMVEAAIIIGRQLIQFLGLGITHKGGLSLIPDTTYHCFKQNGSQYTDEVKITDVAGSFVDPAELTHSERTLLAHFYNGASKATAHITDGSSHQLTAEVFQQGCDSICGLIEERLYKQTGLTEPRSQPESNALKLR